MSMTYGFKSRHPHHVANLQSPYAERSLEVFLFVFPLNTGPEFPGRCFSCKFHPQKLPPAAEKPWSTTKTNPSQFIHRFFKFVLRFFFYCKKQSRGRGDTALTGTVWRPFPSEDLSKFIVIGGMKWLKPGLERDGTGHNCHFQTAVPHCAEPG